MVYTNDLMNVEPLKRLRTDRNRVNHSIVTAMRLLAVAYCCYAAMRHLLKTQAPSNRYGYY